ncbi:MAG TPA: zinc-dependent metalloprotease, partial [Candidatus Alistipes intestinigallinarum]|nr:zinc-dependent metalloprotease [Candidatus Alistipes intestinigallinarum]
AWEFANYAYVMQHADEWIGTEDKDYTFRSLVQASVMNQLYYSFVSVSANLGGIYLNEKYENDPLPTYTAVPRERQRRALRYMLEQLEEMSWLDNHRLNEDVIEVVSLGEYCQDMLSEVIFKSLSTLDLSASKSEDPYTQREAMQELRDYILRDVAAGRESTEANLALQRRLLIDVIRKAGVLEPTRKRAAAFADPEPVFGPTAATRVPSTDPAFAPLPDKARLIRESHLQRTLSGRSPEEIEGMRPLRSIAFRVQPSTDYNYYEMLLNMQQTYRQGLRSGASERMKKHYRYMLLAIERALKVE